MTPSPEATRAHLRTLCPDLGARALDLLTHMYTVQRLKGTDGEAEPGLTRIGPLQGAVLHRLVRQTGAVRTLEIGFAYGYSTVWLLDALPPGGRHVAVDPHERAMYAGVGLHQVQLLGATAAFEWRPAFSIHALSDAIRAGERYDLIFIDGNHRFDDVLVDFYLADQALRPGGIMAFDDMWMPSVRTAVSFVASNRSYQPVTQPEGNMAVFQKVADDARDWRHYVPFQVHVG
jgi:predicted O-methyltransferase YrrM